MIGRERKGEGRKGRKGPFPSLPFPSHPFFPFHSPHFSTREQEVKSLQCVPNVRKRITDYKLRIENSKLHINPQRLRTEGLSPSVQECIRFAEQIAFNHEISRVYPQCIILAIIKHRKTDVADFLQNLCTIMEFEASVKDDLEISPKPSNVDGSVLPWLLGSGIRSYFGYEYHEGISTTVDYIEKNGRSTLNNLPLGHALTTDCGLLLVEARAVMRAQNAALVTEKHILKAYLGLRTTRWVVAHLGLKELTV